MSTARHHPHCRAWLRTLVLLLALLLPGEAYAPPTAPVTAESIVEYDAVDPVLRSVTRAAAPQGPASPPEPAPDAAEGTYAAVPRPAPQARHTPRTVVLRC